MARADEFRAGTAIEIERAFPGYVGKWSGEVYTYPDGGIHLGRFTKV